MSDRPFWARKYGTEPRYSGFSRLTLQGYIGIGWPYAGDLTELRDVTQIQSVLKETMPDDRQLTKIIPRDASILHNFINVAQENDMVACHDQEDGHLFIGRFVGGCIYDTRLHNHFHLLRQVEWMNPLPISLYAGAQQMLTTMGVFWKVSDPQVLLTAYNKFGAHKMRVNRTGE